MTLELDQKFMRQAIEKARDGISQGETPFGACIAKNGDVIACEHNVVWEATDITAHAEVHAIRVACHKLNAIHLTGCTIYATCEPCPMCFSACHWARLKKIVFGASITDAGEAGFNELSITNDEMKQHGKSPLIIEAGFMRDECVELFRIWKKRPDWKVY